MLARYSGLTSLTGTIRLLVEAKAPTGSVGEEVDTTLQYQAPNKLYVRQDRSAPHNKTWIITSDGDKFSYNIPDNQERNATTTRLIEPVKNLQISEIYAAASGSIGDRSAALGIAISWDKELRRIAASWPTHELAGEVEVNGTKAWKVIGRYTEALGGQQIGDYYMIVSKQGDLIEYAQRQYIATPVDGVHRDPDHPTVLTQTWQVHLEPNGTPIPSLFTLVVR
ncbi:MAG TPA: hypothetical protein VKT78_09535 [Fimbriimonadaceae bacterium]|nr:hypothetical protein [Fimbriimonadaceae bacterium]